MKKPVFYALNESVDDAPFITSEQLFRRTGDNTGNLAFTYGTKILLGESAKSFDWSSNHTKSADELLVVSCANQLGAHCDMTGQAEKINKIDMPTIALGLGAQSDDIGIMPDVPQGTINWFDQMASRAVSDAPNIALRGEHTYAYLKSIGREKHCTVLGCPSNLISPFKDLGKRIKDREIFPPKRVAVAAGSPWVPAHRTLERTLADMVTLTGGSYIVQMTLEMIKLARADFESFDRDVLIKFKNFIRPQLTLPEFMQWCRSHVEMFVHVPSWMEHLRKFDFVVGNRIHGVILAIQAGVPALCIAHDSRIVELCEFMRIPYVRMEQVARSGLNLYELVNLYTFDADAYDEKRLGQALEFKKFFANNQVLISNHLDNLCG